MESNSLKKLLKLSDILTAISSFIGVAILILSGIFTSVNWEASGIVAYLIGFIANSLWTIWAVTISMGTIYLLLQLLKISNQLTVAFKDDFKNPLDENWDYFGWKSAKGELTVTGSDQGGITKKGTFWENYILTFEARIINKCLGVIVRAKDLENYYMFQISVDKIIPHRKITIPSSSVDPQDSNRHIVDRIQIAWQKDPNLEVFHRKDLSKWFKTKVIVNGQSIKIYIDGEAVFTNDLLLSNAHGKIGFRNDALERALVRKVKIEML